MKGAAGALLAVSLATALGCTGGWVETRPEIPGRPGRGDYLRFRALHPELLEPNYLPFVTHRVAGPLAGEEWLIFCRWPEDRFPLPVYVEAPHIPDWLQDEFNPQPASAYVAAVYSALGTWERELEGLVRFRPVSRPDDAVLSLHLLAEEALEPESTAVTVLGTTRIGGACRARVSEGSAGDAQVPVRFEVRDVRLFVADASGLLNPDQVERIALHEIGHALGMPGHSPIPADLMFRIARDSLPEGGLSAQDVNTFVSLYRLPNGTVYARAPADGEAPRESRALPEGPPRLAVAPHVDVRYGFEIRPPASWTRIVTSHGMIAVDGVSWDYDASFQVIVRRYPTVESYLERYGRAHLGAGHIRERRELEIAGRRALRVVVEGRAGPLVEENTFIELGDGRLLIVIADCAAADYATYRPWFQAALDSLELWEDGQGGPPGAGP